MTAHLSLSEADLQRRLLDLARLRGWRVAHFRPARTAQGWRTPITGHPGFPDLGLARSGRILAVELKSATGRPTAEQLAWLDALGPFGRLWRPADWDAIVRTLQ